MELRPLSEPVPQRLPDRNQDNEEVYRLIEGLREVISDYKARLRPLNPSQY